MYRIAILLIYVLCLAGCATKITSVKETGDEITISLDDKGADRYYLEHHSSSGDKEVVSSAMSANGSVSFELPYISSDGCFYVKDKDGNSVNMGGSKGGGIKLKVPYMRYRYLQKAISEKNNFKEAEAHKIAIEQELNSTIRSLDSNREKRGDACELPEQLPTPMKPNTGCDSYNECRSDGAQICYAMAFGAEGCSMALSKENVPGVVAGPACGAIASKLAEEKYSLGNAFVDAIRGQADDIADNMMSKDSFFSNIFGLGIKVLNYASKVKSANSCVDNFIRMHYGPLEHWRDRVHEVESEPSLALRECNSLQKKKESLTDELVSAEKEVEAAEERVYVAQKELAAIETTVSTNIDRCQ